MIEKSNPDYLKNGFNINDTQYFIVIPSTLQELSQAMNVSDVLEAEISMHEPDDGNPYYYLHRIQKEYIEKYISSFNEFDNSTLIKNILYLSKRQGIGIGALERILGVSPGYISRTAKENSGKRLSIDIVWKISNLLGISIKNLIEVDMSRPNQNLKLTSQFLEKLWNDTESGIIDWECMGGVIAELDSKLLNNAFFAYDPENDVFIYQPEHLNPEINFVICEDVFSMKIQGKECELIIVPFCQKGDDRIFTYDFYFLKPNKNGKDYYVELAFSTFDDPLGTLKSLADELYNMIRMCWVDVKLTPDTKSFITEYLGGH